MTPQEKLRAIASKPYEEHKDVFYFLRRDDINAGAKNRVKTALKRYPRLYDTLRRIFIPSMLAGLSPRGALKRAYKEGREEKIIVNVGSGVSRFGDDVINLDIHPFAGVHAVADARELPFRDTSVDTVLSEATIEHVPDAHKALREFGRVIKQGGYLYIHVPFLYPFHSSPNDYYRWTLEGLKNDLPEFEVIKTGVRAGPWSALLAALMHVLALLTSFGSKRLYGALVYFWMVILSPLKVIDLLFRVFPYASDAAAVIYFFGRKKP